MPALPFVWYELMTTDTTAAAAFYGSVVGWDHRDSGLASHPYFHFLHEGRPVGGMMALPPELSTSGAPPHWTGYIATPDVDRTSAAIAKAGGHIHHAPTDIPGVGRFAVVADPHGAVFGLFHAACADACTDGPPPAMGGAGRICWRELMAGDGAAAFDFYADQFGWTLAETLDMGEMGQYRIFATGDAPSGADATGSDRAGGIMTNPAQSPAPPHWRFYFGVDDIDAAKSRIETAGGQVLMGPHEVPGGAWIVQAFDPQGALFAVVGPKAGT